MKKIYCISGLAADHRLFNNLRIEGYQMLALPWLPFEQKDTMSTYAAKMAKSIPSTEAIVIGLSFGGMLAGEMAKLHPLWSVFIISSAKTSDELGYNSNFLRWLSNTRLIPVRLFNLPNPIVLYLLGAKNEEEKSLLKRIIRDSDPVFIKWCIQALLHWNNSEYDARIIHIHGTEDKIIYPSRVHPQYWIEGGSHIMIYNRAPEIAGIILKYLNQVHT